MVSKSRDPCQPRPGEYLAALAFITSVILLCLGLGGCSPRIYERVITQRDTLYQVKRDSVAVLQRDSVFVREKGDTIYIYREKVCYRDRVKVDTIYRTRVDSVAVERVKEVQVIKPLSWWERLKIRGFWWLFAGFLALLLWTLRKPLLKLLKL